MSKSLTLELPEKDAGSFESLLDDVLQNLRRLDEEHPKRQQNIMQLQAETKILIRQIKEHLHVAETL